MSPDDENLEALRRLAGATNRYCQHVATIPEPYVYYAYACACACCGRDLCLSCAAEGCCGQRPALSRDREQDLFDDYELPSECEDENDGERVPRRARHF